MSGVMQNQEDPQRMYRVVHEQYSTTTTFSKVTVPRMSARMNYTAQPMLASVGKEESCSVQLVWMHAPMDSRLLGAMFSESFGECWKSLYGMVLSALLTKDDLIRGLCHDGCKSKAHRRRRSLRALCLRKSRMWLFLRAMK